MKIGYTAINKQTGERVDFFAMCHDPNISIYTSGQNAYSWIVNHLDTSYQWSCFPNGLFRY